MYWPKFAIFYIHHASIAPIRVTRCEFPNSDDQFLQTKCSLLIQQYSILISLFRATLRDRRCC